MSHEPCPECGCEHYLYRASCDACQVRLYARVRTKDADGHVVELLRGIERDRGREHAERVRDVAARQRGKVKA